MTRDVAITILKAFMENPLFNVVHKAAFNIAIDTMRKYQMITQIYQKWNEVNDFSYNQAMSQIGEILKDESN